MNFSHRGRYLLPIVTMIIILSPSINLVISQQINNSDNRSTTLGSTTEKPHAIKPTYSESIGNSRATENKIIMFNSFQDRDFALQQLNNQVVNNVYNYIPAIAVDGIDLQNYNFPGLRSVTPDMTFQAASSHDDLYRLSLDIDDGYTLNETSSMIGVDYLKRNYGLTGQGIKIAILDSGVNNSLSSFNNVERTVVSGLSSKGDSDQDGHGTHVAGIAASNGVYNIDGDWVESDSPGMAPGADVISIRVLDETGNGENSWVMEGLEKAIEMDVDIISLSLSTVIYSGPNDPMQELVNLAYSKGIFVVAAAGNSGPMGSAIGIPGSLEHVIAVGASSSQTLTQQELWSFSGIGPTIDGPGPELLAPGDQIISINAADGTYARLSGTSMATPHISGGIALLKEAYPTASYHQIREALLSSAEILFDEIGIEPLEGQGRGQVRFDQAYQILNETVTNNPESHLEMPIYPNIIQDRNYIYQHRQIAQNKTLPFYIYSSRNITINPVINRTEGVTFYVNDTYELVAGKNRLNITLSVISETIRFASGQLYFVENSTDDIIPRSYLFYDTETRFTESHILFDFSHDGDTEGAYYANHGPLGQFSRFTRSLEEQGQIIDSSTNQTITSSLLDNYDMFIVANPDREYSSTEIDAIRSFVEEEGKSIFMIVGGGLLSAEGEPTYPDFNRQGLVDILANSGIGIPQDDNTPFSLNSCDFEDTSYEDRTANCIETATFLTSQSIYKVRQSYPHFGPQLSLTEGIAEVSELARADGHTVAAAAEFPSQGRMIVFSSPLPFDNQGILYDYSGPHTAVSNEQILHTTIDWLLEPQQAQMEVFVGGQSSRSFQINMYEGFQIDLLPQDADHNIIDLGPSINISIREYYPGEGYIYTEQEFVKNGDFYSINFGNGIGINVEIMFNYHLITQGDIPTDSRFNVVIQLKNFEQQNAIKNLSVAFLLLLLASWVVWLLNEGGREYWKKKQNDEII